MVHPFKIIMTVAHYNEAAPIINVFNKIMKEHGPLKKHKEYNNLWETPCATFQLLLTGEGIEKTFLHLGKYLAQHHEKANQGKSILLNIGVSGALKHSLKIKQGVHIQEVFRGNFSKQKRADSFLLSPAFCLSSSLFSKESLYTSEIKVFQKKDIPSVAESFCALVDGELWAQCYLAQHYKIPLGSFKIISDIVPLEAPKEEGLALKNLCQEVRSFAFDLMEEALTKFWESFLQRKNFFPMALSLSNIKEDHVSTILSLLTNTGIIFTHYQHHFFLKLLNVFLSLGYKENDLKEKYLEIFKKEYTHLFQEKNYSAVKKERTKSFLLFFEEIIFSLTKDSL